MPISRWLPQLLICGFAPLLHAATIQSFGIAPNNPLPGDLVTAHFQIDGNAPHNGHASVWIDGVEQCHARSEHGYFNCTFGVPHGGNFHYELRYRDKFGTAISSLQQARSGALRIVKFQPEIVQAGRSAIIFVQLDYMQPAANPQPQGQIQISTTDGARQCTIALPQQTYCQLLFEQAGRYFLTASYSGDTSYPALESAISEIRVINPVEHVIYHNETPLGPLVADTSTTTYTQGVFDAFGNSLLTVPGQVLDFGVGTEIPAFRADLYGSSFVNPSRLHGEQSNGIHGIASTRGELQTVFSESGTIWALDALNRRLVQTSQALVAADTNLSDDWYLKAQDGSVIDWLSKKASGSATTRGVPYAVFSENAIAFVSDENGIVHDDQDGLADVFLAREGLPTLRLPLPANRDSTPVPMRLNSASNRLLLYTTLALTPDDLDTEPDNYLFNVESGLFQRIPDAQSAFEGNFAPDGSVVLYRHAGTTQNTTLMVVPPTGATKTFVLSARANGFQLRGSAPGRALFLGGSNRSQRLLVDLNSGAEHYTSGRVSGDERLLTAYSLSLNATGSHLVSGAEAGLLAARADGTQRQALAAEVIGNVTMAEDERYIGFSSTSALIPEDTNGSRDVYEWDRLNAQLRRLSRRVDGNQITQNSELLAYSRSEGFALISLQTQDQTGTSGLRIARVDLVTGIVTPTPNNGSLGAQPGHIANSRNGRWAIFYGDNALVRVDTQSGATQALAGLYTPPESPASVAISDDGNHIAASIRRTNGIDLRWLNLSTGHTESMFQVTEPRAHLKISADGRYVLVGTGPLPFFPNPNPPPPTRLFVLDLQRTLLSEKLADVRDLAFDFSGDGSMIAYSSYRLAGGQNGGVTLRENPYFKSPSYTSIVRTTPVQPNLAQDFLVEAVVSHKDSGPAPTGVVRFDDGYGAQCDGTLIAQGELAIAQCRLIPNAYGLQQRQRISPTAFELPMTARYLGDSRYSASRGKRQLTISKRTPTFRWLVEQPSIAPEVSIGIEFDTLPGVPLVGSAQFTVNPGVPCFLSAVEIQAGKRCRFFIPLAERPLITVRLDDPIYTLGSGSQIFLTVPLFSNGFE